MFTRITIGDRERALVTRSGRFVEILEPGTTWVVKPPMPL